MFLSAYHFDGPTDELLPAYGRLQVSFPPDSVELQICIAREGGITIYDACPSRTVFEDFHRSPEFLSTVADVGLPVPRVEPLGDVENAYLREAVRP
jgi:hypothetical protein